MVWHKALVCGQRRSFCCAWFWCARWLQQCCTASSAAKIEAFQSGSQLCAGLHHPLHRGRDPPASLRPCWTSSAHHRQSDRPVHPRAVLALYPTGTSTVNDAPLTRMYISEERDPLRRRTALYNKLRSTVVAEHPLASLLPGWSLGKEISQDQLATLLGVDPTATSLQQVNDFQRWTSKQLKIVQPANAKKATFTFSCRTSPPVRMRQLIPGHRKGVCSRPCPPKCTSCWTCPPTTSMRSFPAP